MTPSVRRALLLATLALAVYALFFFPRLWQRRQVARDWPGGFGPAVAGRFYPAGSEELADALDGMLAEAAPTPYPGRLVGLVVPHAGVRFSGPVAAAAFRPIDGRRYDAVAVLGPAHGGSDSPVATLPAPSWRTPLGGVPTSSDFFQGNSSPAPWLTADVRPFKGEHSVEMELIWLQRTLTDFALAPALTRPLSLEDAAALAGRLAGRVREGRVLVVASTDLSHDRPEAEARAMDRETLSFILAGDAAGLADAVGRGRVELCGPGPVLTLLQLAGHLKEPVFTEIAYGTSGDADGNKARVVGYGAVALSDAALPEYEPDGPFPPETSEAIVRVARSAVEHELLKKPLVPREGLPPILAQRRSAFVSIFCGGELRGCIGRPRTDESLYETLVSVAPSAAKDSRFEAVAAEEWGECRVEAQVLSPLERVRDLSRVRVGRDGLVVRRLFEAGLYLPEVPVEQGWDRERFIDETCAKAGIPLKVCRKKGDFFRFQVSKVAEPEGEDALPGPPN